MNALLNRLFLWQKFLLLALFGVFLASVPFALYIHESNKALDASAREVRGIPPARALLKVVVLVQQHRGLSALLLNGNGDIQAQRSAKQKEVEQAIARMDEVAKGIDNKTIAPLWNDARNRWASLAEKVSQRSIPGKQSFAEHTELIAKLLKVNDLLLDQFGLNLDPGADSSRLINVAMYQAPALMESLGRMRARGGAILAAKNASLEDRAAMLVLIERANGHIESIRNTLEKSIAADSSIRARLAAPMQSAMASAAETLQLTTEQVIKPEQFTYAGTDYFAKMTAAIGEQLKFYDASIDTLDRLLSERSSQLSLTTYSLICGILALMLLTAGFAYLITRSVSVPLHEAVAVAKQVASGNLATHIDVSSSNETGQLLQALKDMNDSLRTIVNEVRSGTDTIVTAASQIAGGNLDLSSRTEQQASSLEETASSMEELTATVKQNADNARQANQLSMSASSVAAQGGAIVAQVVDTMSKISESSKRIVDIIGVIDGIAFQTNMLALNAAVEAARAGEHGRGFAVVASEVRNLAQRSASAAREIKSLIEDSVGKVENGSDLANQAGTTMAEIVSSVRRVTDIMGEIAAASAEQTMGIEQVNQAIMQMDTVTQQNAALVEQAAAAAGSLNEQATNLAQAVSVFKLEQKPAAAVLSLAHSRISA